MDGTSFLYTFDDASAAEQHTTQYFEMIGSRALYKDGWWACTRLDKAPWDFTPQTMQRFGPGSGWDPDADPWELYYLPDDFSQAKNIAAENLDKVKGLVDLWWKEAERNRVLPLLGGLCPFFGILPPLPTVTRFAFAGDVQNVQPFNTPRIYGRSYAIEAELVIQEGGAQGVIAANADFIGGYGLWVDADGLLTHTYSFLGMETYKQTATERLPVGEVTVKMLFESDEPKPGSGGHVTLWANGSQIGEGRIERTVPIAFSSYAGLDIGRDNGLVVDRAYEDRAPYAFTGTVKQVVFDLKPVHLHHDDEKALHEAAQHAAVAHGAAA
jgi:arylsulfatase